MSIEFKSLFFCAVFPALCLAQDLPLGSWLVEMQSPGGILPFRLELSRDEQGLHGVVRNGSERLVLDRFEFADGKVRFGIETYDSWFEGGWDSAGGLLRGTWSKPSGKEQFNRLDFVARPGGLPRFSLVSSDKTRDISGRWAVSFRDDGGHASQAIAEFHQDGPLLTGTFLTPTGDYRYLEGVVDGSRLRLSCFDGGHAFLFQADLLDDGRLKGDFWSGDRWHESWTASRDLTAALPDAFALSKVRQSDKPFRFDFPNLEGKQVNQDDPSLQGKPRILVLFGSWCPNCNDEAPYLQQLADRYRDKLEIVALAFEMTGERERDIRSLRRFQKRHGIRYEILLAGTRDKAEAGKSLPDLEKVVAFPTTIFLDREGRVVKIHTGFSGPGTGLHHQELIREFEAVIAELLR